MAWNQGNCPDLFLPTNHHMTLTKKDKQKRYFVEPILLFIELCGWEYDLPSELYPIQTP